MRFLLAITAAIIVGLSCNRVDDTPVGEQACSNNGPIMVDTGSSHFTLPSGFTPNGDGLNDYWLAFLDNVDTAGFSLRVMEGSIVHFATTDPYFQWGPGQFIRQRKEFEVNVTFRARSGAIIETCGRLTIPQQDSFFTCAEDIGGLFFGDQVNIANGAFERATAEEECP